MSSIAKKSQSTLNTALFALGLDKGGRQPLHAQLADALRALILSHPGAAGTRLPASRTLAAELSVSRMTITTAYDQLLSEGYLSARAGSGTFVADHVPHLAPPAPAVPHHPPDPRPIRPFQPGIPDPALFPDRLWARHLERAWRRPDPALQAAPDPFGWYPLRAAIAAHLAAWRGLECDPAQIVVTAGASDAFDLLFRAALTPGDVAVMEDPGWSPLRAALDRAGLQTRPVRIDNEGLDPRALGAARAAIVTPSRHFPTGCAMPLARRLALLDWARSTDAWVIEDDYDSEFRYQGQPLPSLSGLDGLRRTIYLGSFSKLLSATLRLGYLVIPHALAETARAVLAQSGVRVSLVPQPALAAFMDSGEFASHLRRCRRTYAKRQALLLSELAPLASLLELQPDPSGMHLCCLLRPALRAVRSDAEISAACAAAGLNVRALSSHCVLPDPPQGLLLGYAGFDEETLKAAARTLVDVLSRAARKAFSTQV
ncbi:MocR-like pyridoxine biosynthesis transcription factor PdxR [Roseobacter sinensis]|uniref:PLP-dependent aminotransferase family protein n=1 Tax=Roseobacter sinensis TaxID=2931391 RepID=A0ABT3BEQ1_9RHOB|nr:PLP-dependent aminotransferase family protein [Roseobacter sp. WL0113]MCV3272040.1 PLP-dependent aminotransferase family protein [Roseobacter sp. WL0113]